MFTECFFRSTKYLNIEIKIVIKLIDELLSKIFDNLNILNIRIL